MKMDFRLPELHWKGWVKSMFFKKIFRVRDALLKVTDNVGHYEALDKKDKYIVWAEDSESDSVEADGMKKEQTIQGTIDYFTKTDGDENVNKIQNELVEARINFHLSSVQYEEETGFIHFEWIWEVA